MSEQPSGDVTGGEDLTDVAPVEYVEPEMQDDDSGDASDGMEETDAHI